MYIYIYKEDFEYDVLNCFRSPPTLEFDSYSAVGFSFGSSTFNTYRAVAITGNGHLSACFFVDCGLENGDNTAVFPRGMEASVAGFPLGCKQMSWDSCGIGKLFYGISAGM